MTDTAAAEEHKLADWLRDQIVALDAGLLDEDKIAYLDRHVPAWHGPEARRGVGLAH
ncbi:hypothetical protein [Georgenia yuyongxinii]|uniref:hypothetical protein n=1 Tax=Georgenia yuyongxinii TaxID=2589797 RepID=UPI00163D75DC|nr:hypothetical protein [Georgenia yuyongxinii]